MEQVVPATEGGHDGTPAVHTALVHCPHPVGRFVLSMPMPQMPPMHVAVWHEPAEACVHWEAVVHWLATQVPALQVPPVHGLPLALFVKPHVPLLHEAVWQVPEVACGHWEAIVHWTH